VHQSLLQLFYNQALRLVKHAVLLTALV
jgi:hypothetical protein